MRILGIDPSLECTGLAVVEISEIRPELVWYAAIARPRTRITEDRALTLHRISVGVELACAMHHPVLAIVENVLATRGARSVAGQAEARGVCRLACLRGIGMGALIADMGIEWTVRLGIRGRKAARKAQAKAMALELFGIELQEDVADTVMMCWAARGLLEVEA